MPTIEANPEFVAYVKPLITELLGYIGEKELPDDQYWKLYSISYKGPDLIRERELLNKIVSSVVKKNPEMLSEDIVLNLVLFHLIQARLQNYYSDEDFEDEQNKVLNELLVFKQWRDVDIPLAFVELDVSPSVFGDVEFFTPSDQDKKKRWWKRTESMVGHYSTSVLLSYVRVRAPGTTTLAIDYAFDHANAMLLYIRGLCFPLTTERVKQISLINEFPISEALPIRAGNYKWNVKVEAQSEEITRIGPPLKPYNLKTELLEKLGENLEKINSLLVIQVSLLTEMQNKLLLGLKWIGEATKPDSNNARFVKFALALEALMGGETDDELLTTRGLTAAIAERSAVIAGKDQDDKLAIDRQIRQYYSKRSRIVHGNSIEIQPNELVTFGELVRRIALSLLNSLDSFETLHDFQTWIMSKRYS